MPSETPKVKIAINGTAIVLAAAALVAFLAGAEQAAWALAWIYLGSVVSVSAVIAWIGAVADGKTGVTAVGKETQPIEGETWVRRGWRLTVFTVWVAATAVALLYLSFSGYPLMLLPALSLLAFALPGGERLIVDEYIRGVLVRVSSVAHAAGLLAGFLTLVALRPSAVELFAVIVAVYVIVLEWATWRELR